MLLPQAGIALYFFFRRRDLFGPTLFFLLLNLGMLIPWGGPAWLYRCLAALAVYLLLSYVVPPFRRYRFWVVPGRIDRMSVVLVFIFSLVSGLALVSWVYFLKPDLSDFTGQLPQVSLPLLVIGVAFFFIGNAVAEECIFRGIFWDGLQNCFQEIIWVLVIQALYFGVAHYQGFPRGLIGIIMACIYGIFTGVLRIRDKGLLSPVLAHVCADWTIGFLLLRIAGKI